VIHAGTTGPNEQAARVAHACSLRTPAPGRDGSSPRQRVSRRRDGSSADSYFVGVPDSTVIHAGTTGPNEQAARVAHACSLRTPAPGRDGSSPRQRVSRRRDGSSADSYFVGVLDSTHVSDSDPAILGTLTPVSPIKGKRV
jgi:hypothetical protein